MKKQISQKKYQSNILEKNPRIDRGLVKKQVELERELRSLGVDTKPRFNISPPLGSSKLCLYNQQK